MTTSVVVCTNLPFPTRGGPDLRTWQTVNALSHLGPVGVFGIEHRRPEPPPHDWIAAWRSASEGMLISGLSTDLKWMADPDQLPSDAYFSEEAAQELKTLLSELKPQVVVMDQLWLHRYLPVVTSAERSVVLSEHNVEAALRQQIADAQTNPAQRLIHAEFARRVEALEHDVLSRVDQVWACSEADRRLLLELYDAGETVEVIPNGVDVSRFGSADPSPDLGEHAIVFTGQFSYYPNQVAARHLVDEVFPRVATTFGDARLLLVGRFPTDEMRHAAEQDPRVVVSGAVPDVAPYLSGASVMAVPLFQGGGTRFKILEAFAAGLPVVSTPKGAEGLGVEPGVHLLLARTTDEMSDGILRIWNDPSLGDRLAAHARRLVTDRYSWDVVGRKVKAAVENLQPGPPTTQEPEPG